MNERFPYRVTIVTGQNIIAEANQLALCLGEAPGDVDTFGHVWARDAGGTLYTIACVHATSAFPDDAQTPVVAPDHSPDADVDAARAAQSTLVVGTPDNPPTPGPDRVVALLGPNDTPDPLPQHIALMGLDFARPVNINTSHSYELQQVSGIGETFAQAIIDGRPWADPADLSQIPGISDAMVADWLADPGLIV